MLGGSISKGSGTATFINEGVIDVNAGAGTVSVSVALDNHGTVLVESGTLVLSNGGAFDEESTFVRVDSGGKIQFSGGTASLAGTYTGAGATVVNAGTADFSAVDSAL